MQRPVHHTSLAVDPGFDRVGIAVFKGTELIHSECFVSPPGTLAERLRAVHARCATCIRKYAPDSLALETLFFSKNVKTAIAVAEARGVIELAAAEAGIPVHEYSPQAVKIAVTGSGSADKKAVVSMVGRLVPLPERKRFDDEYDAIALGIAHTASRR